MQPLARTPLRRVVAVVMAVALVLGTVPAPALAGTAETWRVSGVDALEPNASQWELLRLDGFDPGDTVYIDVERDGATLASRQPYTVTKGVGDDAGTGSALLAHIVSLTLGEDGRSISDTFGDADRAPVYKVTVRSALRGDDDKVVLYRGTVYPVYAKLVAADGRTSYRLMGIRTASDGEAGAARNLGVGLDYYLQDGDGYRTFVRSADGVDNVFTGSRFEVEYAEAAPGAVSGKVNYVTEDGTVVKETTVGGLSAEGLTVPVERAFFAENVFYRALTLVPSVRLTPEHATAVVRVVPVKEADAGSYQVRVRYVAVDEDGAEQGAPLWTDTLDVVGEGYNYTVPTTFSQRTTTEDRDGTLGHYTEMYTLDADDPVRGGEGARWDVDPENPVVRLEANAGADRFGKDEDGMRTLTVAYRASSQTKRAAVTVYEVDGSTNRTLGPKVTLDVTPDRAATYTPEPTKVVDGVTYELWHGDDAAFTCSWDDIAAGADLMRTVYYVPEGHVPGDPYDVSVRYVDVADNSVLRTDTVRVSPDDVDWTVIEGPETFDQDGESYVRLAGQEGGVRHSYFSPTRTYTVYYRNVNDVLNGQVVVRRTQIIDTVRDVVVGGATLPVTGGTTPAAAGTAPAAGAAAPAGLAAAPAAAGGDAGVTPGDGTTVINDDDNPLASPDGTTTVEQRIEDDENPLARGPLSNGYLVAGAAAGAAALLLLLFWLLRRRRQAAGTTDPNA
ncbi:hypothetical protein [Caniella muris]|uniref:hypothetical protein n=1 Tax=Caniella muris TaxID=2941502 RepID=UPI00203CE581|nr:hypothetical protein [Caniella muris]